MGSSLVWHGKECTRGHISWNHEQPDWASAWNSHWAVRKQCHDVTGQGQLDVFILGCTSCAQQPGEHQGTQLFPAIRRLGFRYLKIPESVGPAGPNSQTSSSSSILCRIWMIRDPASCVTYWELCLLNFKVYWHQITRFSVKCSVSISQQSPYVLCLFLYIRTSKSVVVAAVTFLVCSIPSYPPPPSPTI